MIIITREYNHYTEEEGWYKDEEFKVFDDNDVKGVQDYLDTYHDFPLSFKKL